MTPFNQTFWNDGNVRLALWSNVVATSHVWLPSTWNMAHVSGELNFNDYAEAGVTGCCCDRPRGS